jgi:hypothetical protein
VKLRCGVGVGKGRLCNAPLERIKAGPEADAIAVAAFCELHGLVLAPAATFLEAEAEGQRVLHLRRPPGALTARHKLPPGQISSYIWLNHALAQRRAKP